MDGLELCHKIKTDEELGSIPVIMLTAKNLEEDKIAGYQTGADAYIFKPFKFKYLSLRIENLLALKSNLKSGSEEKLYVSSEKKLESRDQIFLDKTVALVEENINNSQFNVDNMFENMGYSRSNFYRKIKALTGYPAKEFVRVVRLEHAAQMLRENDLSISEVAYSNGFESTSYFTKCFKNKFNTTPLKYKESYRS